VGELEDLLEELKVYLGERGAAFAQAGDLSALPSDWRRGFPVGLSIGVALDPSVIAGIRQGPTKPYANEYARANRVLGTLARAAAELIGEHGYRSMPFAATGDFDPESLLAPIQHKTVATRAGIGWVGRAAILVTKEYGSAVRLTTVLTDAPLPVRKPIDRSLCGKCSACVKPCPAKAITGKDWMPGTDRMELCDVFACRKTAERLADKIGVRHAICGVCIAHCPFTEKYIARNR
jgi:epoxyqueuosine reductase QueG